MASLVADYGTDSAGSIGEDSDSDSAVHLQVDEAKQEEDPAEKLPLPSFVSDAVVPLKSSVFKNPFVEAENAKSAILEKHVKMIPSKNEVTKINGKQICWMYRKGRCRFGHNCKFAHDSDLHEGPNSVETDAKPDQAAAIGEGGVDRSIEAIEREDEGQRKRKKRPGLSQTLVPGKKVIHMYKKQKKTDSVRHRKK